MLEQGCKRTGIILKEGGGVGARLRLRATRTGEIGGDDPIACRHQSFPQRGKLLDTPGESREHEYRVAAALLFIVNARRAVFEP